MKLILGVVLSCLLSVGFISAYATTIDDIERLEDDIEKQQKKINAFQRIIDRLQSLIDLVQSRIDEKLALINELKNNSDILEKMESAKATELNLERFPYHLEPDVIEGICKVSILGFVETVGEKRNTYEPKAYARNVGNDVSSCGINPYGETILKSIYAETENGLNLRVYSHNVWKKSLTHPLYPNDEWFDTFNDNFGSFELNHDDKVKRIAINFSPYERDSYTRYFEFKVLPVG